MIAVTSVFAIAAYWAGECLLAKGGPSGWTESTRPAFVALAAAAVTVLIDVHTRWAAREGMTTVAAASAGVSGVVLILPLAWQLWPVAQRWLGHPPRTHYIGVGMVGIVHAAGPGGRHLLPELGADAGGGRAGSAHRDAPRSHRPQTGHPRPPNLNTANRTQTRPTLRTRVARGCEGRSHHARSR